MLGSPWIRLDPSIMEKLVDGIRPAKIPSKTYIMRRFEENRHVIAVSSGRILLSIDSVQGESKTVMIAEEGCLIGESSAVYGIPSYINAKAITESVVYLIPSDKFRERLRGDAALAWSVIEYLLCKIRLLSSQVDLIALMAPEERLRKILLWLAATHGVAKEEKENEVRFDIRLTQQNFAEIAGLSRVSVANAFARLYRENILAKENGSVYIKDLNALKKTEPGYALGSPLRPID